jgi:drug/metabolite transporter (DMT)-like permease
MLWGLTYTCTEQITKSVDIKSYLAVSCFISTAIYITLGCYDGSIRKDYIESNYYEVWPYMLTGIICSFIACYSSVAAVKYGGAAFASIIEISYPVWVILFTAMLTGKNTVNLQTVIGGLVIFLGTVLVLKSH